jgi:hypothetical protein
MLHATTEQSADNNVSTVGLEEVSVDLEGLYDHVSLRAQRKKKRFTYAIVKAGQRSEF